MTQIRFDRSICIIMFIFISLSNCYLFNYLFKAIKGNSISYLWAFHSLKPILYKYLVL